MLRVLCFVVLAAVVGAVPVVLTEVMNDNEAEIVSQPINNGVYEPNMILELAREFVDENTQVSIEIGFALTVTAGVVQLNGVEVPLETVVRLAVPVSLTARSVDTSVVVESLPTTADIAVLVKEQQIPSSQLLVQAIIGMVDGRRVPQLTVQQAIIDLDENGNEIGRTTDEFDLASSSSDVMSSMDSKYTVLVIFDMGDDNSGDAQPVDTEPFMYAGSSSSSSSSTSDSSSSSQSDSATDQEGAGDGTYGPEMYYDKRSHGHCSKIAHWYRRLSPAKRILVAIGFSIVIFVAVYVVARCICHCRKPKSSRTVYLNNVKLHYDSLPENPKKAELMMVV